MTESNHTNLGDASLQELVTELLSREGVKAISTGLYQPYELRTKYSKTDRQELHSNCVILIGEQNWKPVRE